MGCLQALEIMGRFELVKTTEFELEPRWRRPTGLPPCRSVARNATSPKTTCLPAKFWIIKDGLIIML